LTPTNTVTPTLTPTNTETPTQTPTNTETPTLTPSVTETPTLTPTNTPQPSNTPTVTPTTTVTPSITPSSICYCYTGVTITFTCTTGICPSSADFGYYTCEGDYSETTVNVNTTEEAKGCLDIRSLDVVSIIPPQSEWSYSLSGATLCCDK